MLVKKAFEKTTMNSQKNKIFILKTQAFTDHSQIFDHPYQILIVGGSRSGKIKLLFNLIS